MEQSDYKRLGIDANQETWGLLEKAARTDEETDQMIASAYASHYLWQKGGGTALHHARGHWLISRVMCVANEPQRAKRHAELCARYTDEASDREVFDTVYAVESQARAAALNGNMEKAGELRARAMRMSDAVTEEEDRKFLIGDLEAEPWFGVK